MTPLTDQLSNAVKALAALAQLADAEGIPLDELHELLQQRAYLQRLLGSWIDKDIDADAPEYRWASERLAAASELATQASTRGISDVGRIISAFQTVIGYLNSMAVLAESTGGSAAPRGAAVTISSEHGSTAGGDVTTSGRRGSSGGGASGGQKRRARTGESEGVPASVARNLIGDLPAVCKVRSPISLKVWLTAKAAAGGNVRSLTLPVGSKVDIIVNPVELLKVVGASTGSLDVLDPQPETALPFELAADGVGRGRVEVLAYHRGAALATIELATEVVEALPAVPPPAQPKRAELDMEHRAQPDLSLIIIEQDKTIKFYLQSADREYNFNEYGPITIATPREYFQEFFRSIENLPLETDEDRRKAKERLAEQGLNLFAKAVPEDLQAVLWQLRNCVRTLQISSDEPWIPWEVCKLQGVDANGRVEEGPFFAEAFSVTRWFRGIPAVTRLSFRHWALIVPDDSGLARAADEAGYIRGFSGNGRTVTSVTATASDVKRAMAAGEFDAWHFTGHARASAGIDADKSAIELKAREPFTPAHITGTAENVLLPRPIVFFNACQSAQAGMSLSGAGGWAQRFIKVKPKRPSAAAFIGTYWAVDDDKAFAFAKAFYDELITNKQPIGEAARNARLAVAKQDDPTWLAYTVYADPAASVP